LKAKWRSNCQWDTETKRTSGTTIGEITGTGTEDHTTRTGKGGKEEAWNDRKTDDGGGSKRASGGEVVKKTSDEKGCRPAGAALSLKKRGEYNDMGKKLHDLAKSKSDKLQRNTKRGSGSKLLKERYARVAAQIGGTEEAKGARPRVGKRKKNIGGANGPSSQRRWF